LGRYWGGTDEIIIKAGHSDIHKKNECGPGCKGRAQRKREVNEGGQNNPKINKDDKDDIGARAKKILTKRGERRLGHPLNKGCIQQNG